MKVATEVWIAAALLHRQHPDRPTFQVTEIVNRVRHEALVVPFRTGVSVHAQSHCVANKPPSPSKLRMLYAENDGARRLFRPGDSYHPGRVGGPVLPDLADLPPSYHSLLDWYESEYCSGVKLALETASSTTPSPPPLKPAPTPAPVENVKPPARSDGPRIALVSCVKKKLPQLAPACDLYDSDLFRKSRAWAQHNCDRWYILSAEHGLLRPDTEIEPYEMTLNGMSSAERAAWAQRVYGQMNEEGLLVPENRFVWLAGNAYQAKLRSLLHDHPHEDPLAGLSIGKRLSWLKKNAPGGQP